VPRGLARQLLPKMGERGRGWDGDACEERYEGTVDEDVCEERTTGRRWVVTKVGWGESAP
jgi:hypothetical protein